MILELCKGVHCVDLGESFQTHIYLQILVSTQPRTSPVKFARSSGAAAKLLRAGAGPRERLAQRAVQDHKKTLLVLIAMLPIDSNLLGSEIRYKNTMRNMKIQKILSDQENITCTSIKDS